MGCQMFFVLSGYTIALSYEKNSPSLMSFYKKRWLSLAPGYWLSILLSIILSLSTVFISGSNLLGTSLKSSDIIINVLLLNGLVPTEANNMVFRGGWFVGTIFILYMLYPLLYKGYKRIGNTFLYGTIVTSCILSILCLIVAKEVYSGCGGFLYFSFINQLSPFVLGIYLYYNNLIRNNGTKLKALLFFVLSLAFFYYPSLPLKAVFVPVFFSLSFVCFLKVMWNIKIPCSNLMCSVGKLSYPFYLLHIFFIWDFPHLVLQHYLHLNTATCIIWGVLSFFIVYNVSILYNNLIKLVTNRLKNIIDKLCQKE